MGAKTKSKDIQRFLRVVKELLLGHVSTNLVLSLLKALCGPEGDLLLQCPELRLRQGLARRPLAEGEGGQDDWAPVAQLGQPPGCVHVLQEPLVVIDHKRIKIVLKGAVSSHL